MPYSGDVDTGHAWHADAPSEKKPSAQNSQCEALTGYIPGLHGGQALRSVLWGNRTESAAWSLHTLGMIHLYILRV